MRTIGAAILVAAVGIPSGTTLPETDTVCTFSVSEKHPAADIVGAPDVVARTRVMTQPDSPLSIVRVDLSGYSLAAGPDWFEESGRVAFDVKNVSGEALADAVVWLRNTFDATGGGSGVGTGHKVKRALRPGEHTRVEWRSGPGRGAHPGAGEVAIVALVESVTAADCVYRPSQRWPVPTLTR
jgi:hypothetical protein